MLLNIKSINYKYYLLVNKLGLNFFYWLNLLYFKTIKYSKQNKKISKYWLNSFKKFNYVIYDLNKNFNKVNFFKAISSSYIKNYKTNILHVSTNYFIKKYKIFNQIIYFSFINNIKLFILEKAYYKFNLFFFFNSFKNYNIILNYFLINNNNFSKNIKKNFSIALKKINFFIINLTMRKISSFFFNKYDIFIISFIKKKNYQLNQKNYTFILPITSYNYFHKFYILNNVYSIFRLCNNFKVYNYIIFILNYKLILKKNLI